MKFTIVVLFGLLALGVSAASPVTVSASTTDLDEEGRGIVEHFLQVTKGVISSNGNINDMQDTLKNIRTKLGEELREKGATYLEKLGKVLTTLKFSEDDLNNDIAEKDGVSIGKREKRSPFKSKKSKKSKKGKGGGCGGGGYGGGWGGGYGGW